MTTEMMVREKTTRICNLVIEMLVEETLRDVLGELQEEIEEQIQSGGTNNHERAHGKDRRVALGDWANTAQPFSYNSPTLSALLRAITRDPKQASLELPRGGPPMTYSQICDMLYNCGRTGRGIHVKAPLRAGGIIIPILKLSVPAMLRVLGGKESEARQVILTAFREALHKNGVHYLPYSLRAGSTTISHHLWVSLGGKDSRRPALPDRYLTEGEKQQRQIEKVIVQMRDEDANGSWNIGDVMKLPTYLNRAVRPAEWSLEHASVHVRNDTVVSRVYHWVDDNLDMTQPLHQLAVFVGVMFTYATPYISIKKDVKIIAQGEKSFHDIFKDLPWERTNKRDARGTVAGLPYLTMISTLIIALYEPTSPLRIRLDNQEGMSPEWTTKHGEPLWHKHRLRTVGLLLSSTFQQAANWYCLGRWHIWALSKPRAPRFYPPATIARHGTSGRPRVWRRFTPRCATSSQVAIPSICFSRASLAPNVHGKSPRIIIGRCRYLEMRPFRWDRRRGSSNVKKWRRDRTGAFSLENTHVTSTYQFA